MAGERRFDVAVIGGGIVGMATAMALRQRSRASLAVLEAEDRLAPHQTGNNSGVIHSGLYYKPGSQKARTCVEGREALYRFCAERGIAHERCGKLVVALTPEELPRLEELERRGGANGLEGLRRIGAAEMREVEPHVAGIAGLVVPHTGIVDYVAVTNAYADEVRGGGGEIVLRARLRRVRRESGGLALETAAGTFRAAYLINCAGLQCDRVARLCGARPAVRIVPFRGEYYELAAGRRDLVRNLVYPVPDPQFPFLGVHFTRRVSGGVEAGPNAVLAFKREGYRKTSFSLADSLSTLAFPGFWRLAGRYWRTGTGEMWRSWSKAAFVRALQRLLPELHSRDLVPGGAGVRAQALDRSGALVDDFSIIAQDGMIHVLNAPSPAATASIAIGRRIAEMATKQFSL